MHVNADRPIRYADGQLLVDGVSIERLAETAGTPFWVYSRSMIEQRYARIAHAFAGQDLGIRYAVKANSNAALLRTLAGCGSGFDLVSGGEYIRAQRIGAAPDSFVFAGVGKQVWEIETAIVSGVGFLHIESEAECHKICAIAERLGRSVDVALRINPDVPVDTHAYIQTGGKESKFGVDFGTASRLVARLSRDARVQLRAYHVHLGSLLFDAEPYLEACKKVLAWMDEESSRREGITHYDMGGGFGSRGPFSDEIFDLDGLAVGMRALLEPRGLGLLCEPGRFLIGDAGILVTRLLHEKRGATRDFYVVDAAMNDLIRPTLYSATHTICPVRQREQMRDRVVDVVGPVCESGDWLGKDRELAQLEDGDLLAICEAGAYGSSMSSNYNSRPRRAEYLCHEASVRCIRRSEELDDLWRHECDDPLEL